MSQTKFYCFTLNNYSPASETHCREFVEGFCSYGIIGRETAETGTPHLQGYLILRRSNAFSFVKRRLSEGAHIEAARGTPSSNKTYCSKGGDFWEFGDCPDDGCSSGRTNSRDDLARTFVNSVQGGRGGLVEFSRSEPGTWYYSGHNLLRNYVTIMDAVDRPEIDVEWYFGPPGVGKSRKAHELLPGAYIKEPRTKWWNGYLFERDVIIDDFGPGGIDINHLLRWFDRYKCYVENKGGMLALHATKFIVTSNFHPRQIFSFAGEENVQLPALMRRIRCIEFH